MSSEKSGYKLFYFNVRARAEICRLAFAAAKIDFEDMRLTGDEWAKEKASGRPPLGQMPFIETPEGKVVGQSGAIMKYICKKADCANLEEKKLVSCTLGLCPSDSFDEATADMITDGAADLRDAVVKIHFEKDETKKDNLRKEFFETTLPARLEKYTALLKSRDEGKGFFLGKLTYADITFFSVFNSWINKGEPTVPKELNNFPLLVDHYNRVLNVPEIKAWVEKRPKSDF